MCRIDVTQRELFVSLADLYDEVWRWDVSRQGSEVDSSLRMRWHLRIVLVVQGDARQGSSDGGWVAGVHFFEYDWEGSGATKKRKLEGCKASRGGIWREEKNTRIFFQQGQNESKLVVKSCCRYLLYLCH